MAASGGVTISSGGTPGSASGGSGGAVQAAGGQDGRLLHELGPEDAALVCDQVEMILGALGQGATCGDICISTRSKAACVERVVAMDSGGCQATVGQLKTCSSYLKEKGLCGFGFFVDEDCNYFREECNFAPIFNQTFTDLSCPPPESN